MPAVIFENVGDQQIFCHFAAPEKAPSPKIIIMSHGFRGTSVGPARAFVDFERLLLKAGWSVLRFDQPGCGNSSGNFLSSSFQEWLKTTNYFAEKYLDLGYRVILMGQSMGATTTMVVAGQSHLRERIPAIILWVPDAKTKVDVEPTAIYEEGGQKYRGQFWREAKDADFFGALARYPGGIHLVYGEHDKYVAANLRQQTIAQVKAKGQPYLVLPGQDHSPWEFDVTQKVFQEEIAFLARF